MNDGWAEEWIECYTDGGCWPNPGPGGYGVVLIQGQERLELMGGYEKTTNNRIELIAAIKGLEQLSERSQINLYSDSQYVVNAFTKGWIIHWNNRDWYRKRSHRGGLIPNADLWQRLAALCDRRTRHKVQFHWIRGHNGNQENERCDQLADLARKGELLIDEGFIQRNALDCQAGRVQAMMGG